MENPVVSGLRSRSRSKTPFLRSSCDREICDAEGEHNIHHKSGRKTPVKRSTPVKYVSTQNTIEEEAPTGYRTRYSTRHEKVTSDYSSGESPDRGNTSSKEVIQNEINTQYERGSSRSRQYSGNLADFSISPIQTSHRSQHVTHDRSSSRFGSPSYSVCSTDSSFAEQTLADANNLIDTGADYTHLPYKLYKMAGEYWNKYPKTDYTYSPLSKDRVELAPGQVAVPNMSRRSLSNFRLFGPSTSPDEVDRLAATKTWAASTVRKRYDNNIDGSDDEAYYRNGHYAGAERGWFAQLLVTIMTTVTTATSNAYRKVFGPSHRYPYTDRKPQGVVSRTASAVVAPLYWIITIIKKIVTTTVTTVTETITPNHVGVTETYVSRNYKKTETVKRRWWPWMLLFLLPFAAYGCYNYRDQILPQQTETVLLDTYKSPIIIQDEELAKRVSALENWALSVDIKLKYFDQKLLNLDNLEAQIEQFSVKHLQQNLFQIFTANDNFDAMAVKLKAYFDEHYMNKEQVEVMSRAIHENLLNSQKPDMDEEKIRGIIQEYLGVFERRQMELIKERVKVYVKEIEIRNEGGFDIDAVRKIVADMLTIYDADKTGLVDYALESAGGQVISTKCTEMYHIKTKQYFVLGIPMWWDFTSPRYALTAGAMPSECWAFQNFPGYLVIRTYAIIEVTGFSIEHMSRLLAVDGKIESAPKNFSVYGLHGELDPNPHLFGDYMYDANGTSIQYFPVQHHKTTNIGGVEYPVAYDIIELRIESNHGNPNYTCLYRFRVHGNPLSDIRRATEDSMKDSET